MNFDNNIPYYDGRDIHLIAARIQEQQKRDAGKSIIVGPKDADSIPPGTRFPLPHEIQYFGLENIVTK